MAAIIQEARNQQNVRSFPNGVTVRNMTSADCEFAATVVIKGFEGKTEHVLGRHNMEKAVRACEEQHRLMGEHYHRIWIAEVDGRPAGYMKLAFHGERTDVGTEAFYRAFSCRYLCRMMCFDCASNQKIRSGECYLNTIAVDEDLRGKGVGKCLLQVADEEALKNNCKVIYLGVAEDNRAKGLYEREGYVEAGEKSGCLVRCATGVNRFIRMDKHLSH